MPERLLSRPEAVEYLNERGLKISVSTLEKMAVRGGGPPYRKFGGRWVNYTPDDLDAWAEARLGPRLHSTSDEAV